jgi:hypothetical protein
MFVGDDERLLSFLNMIINKGSVCSEKVWEIVLECQIRREARAFQQSQWPCDPKVSEVIRLLDRPKVSHLRRLAWILIYEEEMKWLFFYRFVMI